MAQLTAGSACTNPGNNRSWQGNRSGRRCGGGYRPCPRLADELLVFESGVRGMVLDLEPGRLGVILLGPSESISLGEDVRRTRKVVSVPVGPALLGRVVDAMGRPRDGLGDIAAVADTPIEAEAPGVLSRSAIFRPLATGIKAIDAAVPVGLGQREL